VNRKEKVLSKQVAKENKKEEWAHAIRQTNLLKTEKHK